MFLYLDESRGDEKNSSYLQLSSSNDVNILLELKDWLFALESADEMAESHRFDDLENSYREECSWHTSFESFKIKANGSKIDSVNGKGNSIATHEYPIELVRVRMLTYVHLLQFLSLFFS